MEGSDEFNAQPWNEKFRNAIKKLQAKKRAEEQENDPDSTHSQLADMHHASSSSNLKSVAAEKFTSMADAVQAVASAMYDKDGRISIRFSKESRDEDLEIDQFRPMGTLPESSRQEPSSKEDPDAIVDSAKSPPSMNICIMIVGTRGDVQPFIMIGKRLQQDGHRVRLATHAPYRELVTSYGLEFYPLAGDPKELAAYMVKTGGHLIPYKYENIRHDIPRNMQMIDEIIQSTWPAVQAPDPDGRGHGREGPAFRANAIISNPVTYGHIHVAERLGVPLHIMFPLPWVPTIEFPHPMANLPYTDTRLKRNYLSYKVFDLLMWQGTERMINEFRVETLGLRKIRKGDGGRDILLDLKIPHSFLWTPILVPKPIDWDSTYHVVGTIVLKEDLSKYVPPPGLEEFLAKDDGAIFVGFGSMVLQDPIATTKMIIDAANLTSSRVVIQSSWSDMSGVDAPDSIFFLGNCPHEWLFPRVSAVVHHGGAGTTAAGLLVGKPTFIVPFFGDQPFWGRYVVKAGVGVEPCPINDLTTERLTQAFTQLRSSDLREKAHEISKLMQAEKGVERAVKSFYYHLPVDRMLCDLDHSRFATKWNEANKLKLCPECDFVVSSRPDNRSNVSVPYDAVNYSARGPDSEWTGASSGAAAFLHELGGGFKDVFVKPAKGYRREGARGAVIGVAKGIGGFFVRPIQGVALFADHIVTGHHNARRAEGERKKSSVLLENARLVSENRHIADQTNEIVMTKKGSQPLLGAVHVQLSDELREQLQDKFREIMKQRSCEDEETLGPASSQNAVNVPEVVDDVENHQRPSVHQLKQIPVLRANWSDYSSIEIHYGKYREEDNVVDESTLRDLMNAAGQEVGPSNMNPIDNVPSMNICMTVPGFWDENVKPVAAVGVRLKQEGHRVRIATHEVYRERVKQLGLEFYPLKGQPATLRSIPKYLRTHTDKIRIHKFWENAPELADMRDMVFSQAAAVVDPDPQDPGLPFRADILISHPMMIGQVYVAERLGIPLHCMSAYPLTPTHAFAHPLSTELNLSQPYKYLRTNFMTYNLVNSVLWSGMREILDDFRNHLGLHGKSEKVGLLWDWAIPHTYLWNPLLLPKPVDWCSEVTIAGAVDLDDQPRLNSPSTHNCSYALEEFLGRNSDKPKLFFSFHTSFMGLGQVNTPWGSIEMAAELADVCVILQSDESNDDTSPSMYRTERVFQIPMAFPYKKLLERVSAVLHSGESSVVARTLAAGKPICIIPLHSSQRLWALSVVNAGVGVGALEPNAFRAESIAQKFKDLLDPMVQTAAQRFAANSATSDEAVNNAVQSIYANLPLKAMQCDLDETKIARTYDPVNQLKLSHEAQVAIRSICGHDCSADVKYKPLLYSLHHAPRLSLWGVDEEERSRRNRRPSWFRLRDAQDAADRVTSSLFAIKSGRHLSTMKSTASIVVEQPCFWKSKEEEQAQRTRINAAYETLMMVRKFQKQ